MACQPFSAVAIACRASCRTGGNAPENRLSDVECLPGSKDKVTGVIADNQAVSGKILLHLDGAAADSIIGVRIVVGVGPQQLKAL